VDYSLNREAVFVYSTNRSDLLPDGSYKFEATINRDGSTLITSGTFTFNYHAVPPVDYQYLSYGSNYYFDTTTPTFSWAAVPGTYYRLRIFETSGNVEVYSSNWASGGTGATVPTNILLPGASYYWTVQSSDYSGSDFNTYNYPLFGSESGYKEMSRFTIR